jgi:hypothetical protein
LTKVAEPLTEKVTPLTMSIVPSLSRVAPAADADVFAFSTSVPVFVRSPWSWRAPPCAG